MKVYKDTNQRVPIKSWAVDPEQGALDQAKNLANLPFAIKHVALMPDAHQGYGMPIGGVLFADRAVVPYAIGVDIGCGVALVETDLTIDDLSAKSLQAVLRQIARDVPVGQRSRDVAMDADALLNLMGVDLPAVIQWGWFQKATQQVGTLGGGNHFLEVQGDADGRVYFMLHSGSRALGKLICDHYHKIALEQNTLWHSALPHRELAYLPVGTPDFHDYWESMEFALRFAEVNRQTMLVAVESAFRRNTPISRFEKVVDVHHNYATWENHFGQNGIVHRKGAVRAREGDTVLIPGSMGTASYIATGLGSPESFHTCQHGAGRLLSRSAARKMITAEDLLRTMNSAGVLMQAADPSAAVEEAPGAYKDIDLVMEASTDLITASRRLVPIGVVKG